MDRKIQGIYKIRNLLNSKVYIGQSLNINNRFRVHKFKSNKNQKHPLYSSIRKYGIENFEFTILEEVPDVSKLDNKEQYWLNYYKSYNSLYGYNLRTDCISNRGFKHTKETKEKMSLSKKGIKRKPLSKEHKLKLSESHTGKKQTKETIQKRIDSRKGYVCSDKTKRKIGLANKGKLSYRKGKKLPEEHRKNISLSLIGKKLSEEHKRNISLKIRKSLNHTSAILKQSDNFNNGVDKI